MAGILLQISPMELVSVAHHIDKVDLLVLFSVPRLREHPRPVANQRLHRRFKQLDDPFKQALLVAVNHHFLVAGVEVLGDDQLVEPPDPLGDDRLVYTIQVRCRHPGEPRGRLPPHTSEDHAVGENGDEVRRSCLLVVGLHRSEKKKNAGRPF